MPPGTALWITSSELARRLDRRVYNLVVIRVLPRRLCRLQFQPTLQGHRNRGNDHGKGVAPGVSQGVLNLFDDENVPLLQVAARSHVGALARGRDFEKRIHDDVASYLRQYDAIECSPML